MQAIVCLSGGHSSALAAIEAVRRYGKERVTLVNHDIAPHVEHEDVKRFKADVAAYCGIPITPANSYKMLTPLEVSMEKKAFSIGNGVTFCTSYLKTEPFYRYLSSVAKSKDVHIVYGFDAEEEHRIFNRSTTINAMGYTPVFPLAEWPRTLDATEDIGIRRPVTYRIYKHANCIGCLKAGRQHWYCVYCLRSDIWEEAKAAEKYIGHSIIKGVYLHKLEPQFTEMREKKHICPTDKMEPNAFWAKVEATLPEQETLFPCDCSF